MWQKRLHSYRIIANKLISIIFLVLFGVCCSQDSALPQGNDGATGLDSSKTSWIFGTWEGSYQNLNAALESEQRDTSAWLELQRIEPQSGSFHLKLSQLEGVYAKGSFTEVNNLHLMMKIQESNLSSLGSPGSSRTFDYDLASDTLTLTNPRAKMILARTRPNDPSSKPETNTPESSKNQGLQGRWKGADQPGRSWVINILGDSRFTIEIRDFEKAPLWMLGKLEHQITQADQSFLIVEESSLKDYIGFYFRIVLIDEKTIEFQRLGKETPPESKQILETFICTQEL